LVKFILLDSSILAVTSWLAVDKLISADVSLGTIRASAVFSIYGTGRLSGSGSFSVDLMTGIYFSSCSFSINLSPTSSDSITAGASSYLLDSF
jgi:hypothetical protein